MKMLLGVLAAAMLLVGVGAAQPASARCFWNGFTTQCYRPYHSHWWWRHHHVYRPYAYEWGYHRY